MALLDTTVLIDLSRGKSSKAHSRAVRLINDLRANAEALFTSRLNEAEFRVGQFRSTRGFAERDRIEIVLAGLAILEFDAEAALQFAQTRARLLDQGKPVGEIDTQVASVAIVNRQTLVTRNVAHFVGIEGLTLITY